MHLDPLQTVARAGLAAPAFDVEAEAPGVVAARPRLGRAGKDAPDLIEDADVGGRVGARGAPDGLLGDVDHLVELLQTLQPVVGAGGGLGVHQRAREGRVERLADQAALAAAADAGDAGDRAEREARGDVLEVVQARAREGQPAALGRAAAGRWGRSRAARRSGSAR